MRTTTEIIAEIKAKHPRVLYVDVEQTPEQLEELLAALNAGLMEHTDEGLSARDPDSELGGYDNPYPEA